MFIIFNILIVIRKLNIYGVFVGVFFLIYFIIIINIMELGSMYVYKSFFIKCLCFWRYGNVNNVIKKWNCM